MEPGKTARVEILSGALPASSPPDVGFLIVVSPKEADLYQHPTKVFAGVRGVKVIMERRRGDRRQQKQDYRSG